VILTNERNEHMTSARKVEANRQNALKSTGPKTPEGKNASRLNSLRHGLLSEEILLPGENEEVFRQFGERLRAELQPVGELENLLVDRIVEASWRLRRLRRVESGIFAWGLYEEQAERAEQQARKYESTSLANMIATLSDVTDSDVTDKEKHEEALSKARQLRSEQESESARLGQTFARDADKTNAFSKLARYETTIDRKFYKALHELERRQAARRGGDVPAPLAVDVDVSGLPEGDR
jgi:hypothetical protein